MQNQQANYTYNTSFVYSKAHYMFIVSIEVFLIDFVIQWYKQNENEYYYYLNNQKIDESLFLRREKESCRSDD